MRPSAIEMLRGLQGTLTSDIVPEVSSLFGQDVLQISQMLLETAISEIDAAADYLVRDNETLVNLLHGGHAAIENVDRALAGDIAALEESVEDSLTLSALSARNQRLRGLLERLLALAEDHADRLPKGHPLMAIRSNAYRHLREVATRGWSFWDVFSFRERMAKLRSAGT